MCLVFVRVLFDGFLDGYIGEIEWGLFLWFRRALFNDNEALLSLALVPLESAGDGVKPVSQLFVHTNGWEWVF